MGRFLGYVLTRTTGLPGATDDIGNWGDPLGVASLLVEGLLVLLAVAGFVALRTAHTKTPAERHRVLAT